MITKKVASNMREYIYDSGLVILISYWTPVAAWDGHALYVDERKYSVTTSKHITKWKKMRNLTGKTEVKVNSKFLDDLVAEET